MEMDYKKFLEAVEKQQGKNFPPPEKDDQNQYRHFCPWKKETGGWMSYQGEMNN